MITQGEVKVGRQLLRESISALLSNYGNDAPTLIRVLVVAEAEERDDGNLERVRELASIRDRLERRVEEHRQSLKSQYGQQRR